METAKKKLGITKKAIDKERERNKEKIIFSFMYVHENDVNLLSSRCMTKYDGSYLVKKIIYLFYFCTLVANKIFFN